MTLRFLTAGESHGPKLTGIIEGLPAGFIIDPDKINYDLSRRQKGFGRGGRMKIESDCVSITSGVIQQKTTGAPVAIEINNIDYKNWHDKDIEPMSIPRPGHADFAGAFKYQHDDLRLTLERSSARETAMRTAVGSICKQLLSAFDIAVYAYVVQVGSVKAETRSSCNDKFYQTLFKTSLNNQFAFIDESKLVRIEQEIRECMKAKDTLGGVFETVALGLPCGLGSYVHYDRKLDGILAQAMMSIPAMKGVEIGDGIDNASLRGTEVHDEFVVDSGLIKRSSNRAGGLEGGVSNGMPLITRVYMKPISTTLTKRKSVDLSSKKISETIYERSDFSAIQRACVIGESMKSFVLLGALMEKIGSDNKQDMQQAFASLAKGSLDDLEMKKTPWRFDYAL